MSPITPPSGERVAWRRAERNRAGFSVLMGKLETWTLDTLPKFLMLNKYDDGEAGIPPALPLAPLVVVLSVTPATTRGGRRSPLLLLQRRSEAGILLLSPIHSTPRLSCHAPISLSRMGSFQGHAAFS